MVISSPSVAHCMVLSKSSFLSLVLCGHLLLNGVVLTDDAEDLFACSQVAHDLGRASHSAQRGKQFEGNAEQAKVYKQAIRRKM